MDVLHRVSKDSVVAEIRSLDSSGLGTSSRCNKGRGSLETRDKSLLSPPSLLPYGYETLWTPLADSEKRIKSFETKCLMKLHRISYSGHKTNPTGCGARSASSWVHWKLFWQLSRDGHSHGSGMLQATTASPKPFTLEGGRRRGRQRKCWMDSVIAWTFLPMPELLITALRIKD